LDPGLFKSKSSAFVGLCRFYQRLYVEVGHIMRDFSHKTVRPVSEHFHTKCPEDVAFYMSSHENTKAVVDKDFGSYVEQTDVGPVYDRKHEYYRPANDDERAMDKKLNFKLDFIVIVICAINFVVCDGNILTRLNMLTNM
jgi:hypothetical protein